MNNRQELEEKANIFSLKCLVFTEVIHAVVWILNILNIFIVDSDLMLRSFLSSFAVMVIPIVVCKIAGLKRPWIKYFIMFALIVSITIVSANLTYHALLLIVLPLLYSAQYCSRKMTYFAYALSVLSMYIAVMAGSFCGLCDANMAAITIHPLSEYCNEVTGQLEFGTVNSNPWLTLPLYYVLPRSLLLLLFVPLIRHVSDTIAERAVRERDLIRMSEVDEMTSLYNRNKYNEMIEEYYPAVASVGVIFWDINRLKTTNDTMGHEYGDYLIASVAESIKKVTGDKRKAFRIGGDEFVMIVEDATEELIKEILEKWARRMENKNNVSKIKISAAVGYALGEGAHIEDVVRRADAAMYAEKKEQYHG